MAAATGYGNAPTDEQLLAYAELPKHGRYLAEVFAVRVPAAAGGNSPRPAAPSPSMAATAAATSSTAGIRRKNPPRCNPATARCNPYPFPSISAFFLISTTATSLKKLSFFMVFQKVSRWTEVEPSNYVFQSTE